MRDNITIDREIAAIRLMRDTFAGTFLLVEGGSDKKFYQRFVSKDNCQIRIISGKPSSKERILKVVECLEREEFLGVLAIVDSDFDRLQTNAPSSPNLLRTDTHDLEMMLIKSPALEKVVLELGSEPKIANLEQDLRNTLLNSGLLLGYLLWISVEDGLNLKFSDLKYAQFIDDKNLQIDEKKAIEAVKNKSQNCDRSIERLQARVIDQKAKSQDAWQICCGHHLVCILQFALRKTIGDRQSNEVKPEILERELRLACETRYFQTTELYQNLLDWQARNLPFQVL